MGRTYRYDKQGKQSWDGQQRHACNCGTPGCPWCESARSFSPRAASRTAKNKHQDDQWVTDDVEDWDSRE